LRNRRSVRMHVGVPFPDEARTGRSPTLLILNRQPDDGSTRASAHLAGCALSFQPVSALAGNGRQSKVEDASA
jgi:hypothetical protein